MMPLRRSAFKLCRARKMDQNPFFLTFAESNFKMLDSYGFKITINLIKRIK